MTFHPVCSCPKEFTTAESQILWLDFFFFFEVRSLGPVITFAVVQEQIRIIKSDGAGWKLIVGEEGLFPSLPLFWLPPVPAPGLLRGADSASSESLGVIHARPPPGLLGSLLLGPPRPLGSPATPGGAGSKPVKKPPPRGLDRRVKQAVLSALT